MCVAKSLAPYRIGKCPTSKIGEKYPQNTENRIFLVFLMCFWAILRVAVFSYPVGGQVFPKGCGPDLLLGKVENCVFQPLSKLHIQRAREVRVLHFTGWRRNRTGTRNRNRRNRFSRNRQRNRNRRNRFQEPEPCHPLITVLKTRRKPFPKKNRRNRKPEPREPFHARTVTRTEPNRGHPDFIVLQI